MSSIVERIRSWNRKRLASYRAGKARLRPDLRKSLAVMGIVKNEALNIDEWIGHYIWQGADHIFLIDNGSTDDTVERISRWLEGGCVTLVIRPEKHRQRAHYKEVYRQFGVGQRFKWLLVADADEFWFATGERTLPEALEHLDAFDLVYCQWTIFGSGGEIKHPQSLRQTLVQRDPAPGPHELSKWVAKTEALDDGQKIHIHRIKGICSTRTVTESHRLQVNHYVTQSQDYWWNVKMVRGDAFDPANDTARDIGMFDSINAACTVEDRTLADLVEAAGPAAWGRGG